MNKADELLCRGTPCADSDCSCGWQKTVEDTIHGR